MTAKEFIKLRGGVTKFADKIGANRNTVASWYRRDSVPASVILGNLKTFKGLLKNGEKKAKEKRA